MGSYERRGAGRVRIAMALSFFLMTWAVVAEPSEQTADQRLARLIVQEWDYQMEQNPVWASLLGDHRFSDRWDDVSPTGRQADLDHNRQLVKRLEALAAEPLSDAARLDLDLLLYDLRQWIEEDEGYGYWLPVSHLGWPPEGFRQRQPIHTAHQLASQLRFETLADYQNWLARLHAFPVYVDQTVELMSQGLAAGRVRPRVVVERLIPLVAAQAAMAAQDSGYFAPFLSLPETLAEKERRALHQDGLKAVSDQVLPALERYLKFLRSKYLPAAPESPALGDLKGGTELYDLYVRKYTTTNMSAAEVHELGLKEVKRIRAEMEAIRLQVGFAGDLEQFFDHLRTDSKFFYQQPQDLLTAYRALAKRVDPLMVKLFGRLPRMPYGVEPIDAAIAPQATTGYYFPAAADGSRAGTYQVNLYQPESRPKWEMIPLSLHEAVPGHHLQVSLAAELEGLSSFRRFNYHSAYGEGWGLYAEFLGYELGLYDDPYDRFGALAFEMWRAVRLVVDTGLHSQGWSRQRAIDFFLENSPRPKLDVINEIDRYIAIPGQALSYKIGQLEILRLRREAEKRLADKFDPRSFHDQILGAGSVPLAVLESRIKAWLVAQEAQSSAP